MLTQAYRLAGPCVGLSVVAASHAAVLVTPTDPSANAVLIENTSTTVAVFATVLGGPQVASGVQSAPASIVPPDGAAGSNTILPLQSKVIAVPAGTPVSVTAIGAGAGPSLITVTPITGL